MDASASQVRPVAKTAVEQATLKAAAGAKEPRDQSDALLGGRSGPGQDRLVASILVKPSSRAILSPLSDSTGSDRDGAPAAKMHAQATVEVQADLNRLRAIVSNVPSTLSADAHLTQISGLKLPLRSRSPTTASVADFESSLVSTPAFVRQLRDAAITPNARIIKPISSHSGSYHSVPLSLQGLLGQPEAPSIAQRSSEQAESHRSEPLTDCRSIGHQYESLDASVLGSATTAPRKVTSTSAYDEYVFEATYRLPHNCHVHPEMTVTFPLPPSVDRPNTRRRDANLTAVETKERLDHATLMNEGVASLPVDGSSIPSSRIIQDAVSQSIHSKPITLPGSPRSHSRRPAPIYNDDSDDEPLIKGHRARIAANNNGLEKLDSRLSHTGRTIRNRDKLPSEMAANLQTDAPRKKKVQKATNRVTAEARIEYLRAVASEERKLARHMPRSVGTPTHHRRFYRLTPIRSRNPSRFNTTLPKTPTNPRPVIREPPTIHRRKNWNRLMSNMLSYNDRRARFPRRQFFTQPIKENVTSARLELFWRLFSDLIAYGKLFAREIWDGWEYIGVCVRLVNEKMAPADRYGMAEGDAVAKELMRQKMVVYKYGQIFLTRNAGSTRVS